MSTTLTVTHPSVLTNVNGELAPKPDEVVVINEGDFVEITLVTDTRVYEVVKTTPKSMTLRETMHGAVIQSRDWMSWYEVKPDPNGTTKRVMMRRDGTYRDSRMQRSYRPADTIDRVPVRRVDFSF